MITKLARGWIVGSIVGPRARETWLGLLTGGGALAALVATDVLVGNTGFLYVLPPFIAAVFAVPATAIIAVAAIALGAVSPLWNHDFGSGAYWVRLVEVAVGSGFATFIALRRARMEVGIRRLRLLDDIGSFADGSLPLDETLRRAIEGIVPAAADIAMIDAIHDTRVSRLAVRVRGRDDWPTIERAIREREPSTPPWLRNPGMGIPPVPWYLPRVTSGHVEIISHGGRDLDFLRSLNLHSQITVPMIARSNLLGTLTLVSAWSRRRYQAEDLLFAKALASRLALALDQAGLFSDLESVERRMDAVMSKIPEAVTVHDGTGNLVYANDVAAAWAGLASADELLGADLGDLRARFELFDEEGVPLTEADLVSERMALQSVPVRQLVRIVRRDDRRERWAMLNAQSILGPDEKVLYVVTTIEDVTDTKRAELRQRLLARTGELLEASADYRATLQAVAELAVPGFADWCSVNVAGENGELAQVAVIHVDRAQTELARALWREHRVPLAGRATLARVLETGEPSTAERPLAEMMGAAPDTDSLSLTQDLRLGPTMAVPMAVGTRTVGALVFAHDEGHPGFDPGDLDLAREMGRRAALAIEHARLAEMRSEIAETLQRGLRPPELPAMPGWRVATMYRPAGELNEVGGDFYDALKVDAGWMIAVGDVVGRGAAAAALTALARHTIEAASRLTGDPEIALRMLNDRLREREDAPLCSVAIVVLAEPEHGSADAFVVSAGHPLPLLLREGAVQEAAKPGPMLGTMSEPRWEMSHVLLEPADQLVVYTDGVTEARVDGELFGQERLEAAIAGAADPQAVVAGIESALVEFAAERSLDDAAVVAIMRTPDRSLPPVPTEIARTAGR